MVLLLFSSVCRRAIENANLKSDNTVIKNEIDMNARLKLFKLAFHHLL